MNKRQQEELLKMVVNTRGLKKFGGRKAVRKHIRENRLFRPVRAQHPTFIHSFYRTGEEHAAEYHLLSCNSIEEAKEIMRKEGYTLEGNTHNGYAETSGRWLHEDMDFKIVGTNRVITYQFSYLDC